jgi:hypothetical protein
MKTNYILLLKVIILEIIYFYTMFFVCLFSLFLYFGSGASASSSKAILTGNIIMITFIIFPILYNFRKMILLKKANKEYDFNSYFLAQILLFIFILYHIKIGFISIGI